MPERLIARPGFLLVRLGFAMKARSMEAFEQEGLSPYHYSVLELLAEKSRETQAEIADALRLDRSQLVGLLDGLEEDGLIERHRDPNDRRRHFVSLTPDGKRAVHKLRALVSRLEDEFMAPLDAGEREALRRLLLRVACHHDTRFPPPEPS